MLWSCCAHCVTLSELHRQLLDPKAVSIMLCDLMLLNVPLGMMVQEKPVLAIKGGTEILCLTTIYVNNIQRYRFTYNRAQIPCLSRLLHGL